MERSATLLLGLPGAAVARVERWEDGARVVHILTAGEHAGVCPECGVVSASCKQQVATRPRDIPSGTEAVERLWHKPRWRCRHPVCPRRTFTDAVPQVPARRRRTGRLRAAVAHAAAGNRSVAEVAADHGVGWSTVQACVDEYTDQVLTEPEPTPVLGIDETRRGKPRWNFDPVAGMWLRVDRWDTSATVIGWLGLRGQVFRGPFVWGRR